MKRGEVDPFAIESATRAERRVAESQRAGCDGVEHRLRIGPRARYDVQNFAGCSLLLESLGERGSALSAADGGFGLWLSTRARRAAWPGLGGFRRFLG
jgi:hypothetical protein